MPRQAIRYRGEAAHLHLQRGHVRYAAGRLCG